MIKKTLTSPAEIIIMHNDHHERKPASDTRAICALSDRMRSTSRPLTVFAPAFTEMQSFLIQ